MAASGSLVQRSNGNFGGWSPGSNTLTTHASVQSLARSTDMAMVTDRSSPSGPIAIFRSERRRPIETHARRRNDRRLNQAPS